MPDKKDPEAALKELLTRQHKEEQTMFDAAVAELKSGRTVVADTEEKPADGAQVAAAADAKAEDAAITADTTVVEVAPAAPADAAADAADATTAVETPAAPAE